MNEFEVTENHIKLIRKMYVNWCEFEFGAPTINPKRPYGNSSVVYDIAEIIGIPPDEVDENKDDLINLHRECETALQIVLNTGSFEPGIYELVDFHKWKRKEVQYDY